MNLTLRYKVNGAIIITFLIIALVFTAIQVPFHQRRLETATRNIDLLLKTLVERDREQLANEIFDTRFNAIKIRLKQMRSVDGIIAIGIFDASGKLLMSDGVPFPDQEIDKEAFEKIRQNSQTEKKRWQGQTGLLYTQEIRFLTENMGFIRIFYSLAHVEHEQRQLLLIFGGLLASILFVMLIVLNLILSKVVLNPILHLRDATRSIARGNLDEDIHIRSKDELGNLAESFEDMRDAIKTNIADLKRLTTIMESTSDLVFISKPDDQMIYMNRAGRKMVGWSDHESLDGKSIADVHPPWAYETVKDIGIPAAVANGIWEGETALIGADGKEFPVSQVIMSHKTTDGETEYLSTIIRDISESKEIENSLRLTQFTVDRAPDAVMWVRSDARFMYVNDGACSRLGYTREELLTMTVHDIAPEFPAEAWPAVWNEVKTGEPAIFETIHRTKEGLDIPTEIVTTFFQHGEQEFHCSFARDITERKRAEEKLAQHQDHLEELVQDRTAQLEQEIEERKKAEGQIAASLAEKEVLLREIHHRVKNNLNTVSNLLYLQSRTLADPRSEGAFLESRNRIQTMARVHELLYRSDSLARIDMDTYFKELTADLAEAFPRRLALLHTAAAGVTLEIDRAIPCGLIVTELVSNSFKYAFATDTPEDRISVELSAQGDEYRLVALDNGCGLPEGLKIEQIRSLGLRLVEMLTRQLHGTFEINSAPGCGTRFCVSFKVNELEEK